jgi:menaquinone-dependent protoporphyrinogen oxidase
VHEEGDQMTVLVAYASKHGSTGEIAEALAEQLRERGHPAEVASMDAADPAGAEAVVLGSAVYAGSWLNQAARFVERNRAVLNDKPVWLFSSGPTGTEPPPTVGVSEKQLTTLREAIHPRDHRLFAGALDPSELGFVERHIVKAVKAPTGDFRDWDRVARYADEIAESLPSS